MPRTLLTTAIWLLPLLAQAQTPKYDVQKPQSVMDYIDREVRELLRDRDPLASRLRQEELERLLAGLPTDDPALKDAVAQAAMRVQMSRHKVYEQVTPLAVIIQKVNENLDDAYAVYHLGAKLHLEVYPLRITNPDEGARILAEVRAVFDKVEQATPSELTKRQLERGKSWAVSLGRDITYAFDVRQQQQAKIGQDALPLKVETWLNGSALTPTELKGHVVLLDFFSAYSFVPNDEYEAWLAHLRLLRTWQQKYVERGLITIGITTYQNFRWSDAAQKPVRIDTKNEIVPPVEQQALFILLAQQHGLAHRLAILERSEYTKTILHYPSMTRPHLAVIDRQGKIRLIRGGDSARFDEEVSQMLETLLGRPLSK